ncbi:inhibitor of apoptosis-promoting Bax1-domain-containing protein [Naematelia encephala]|uniref:Inhibitor of apoptosis-promoting Bax1-domain-containing protein n=1 Tax=Naematelia encephala TaxID=71784 RepID=A0A1Y2B9V0_9TREE|nr:inhibitor of apoptosis-promoting Bax1-domain-containing protein [Naematelia encephala]
MASPPKYTDSPTKGYGTTSTDAAAVQPLLAAQAGSSRNAWMNQPAEDDIPEDFKIGVAVIDCDASIRLAFIRKVYAILFVQLLVTSLVALGLSTGPAVEFTGQHPWIMWIPILGSFTSLAGVYWKRHQHPANLILLGLFTIFEAMMVGLVTSYYDSRIVLQALFITLGVFTGLTLFTFQTKFDFSSFGPFLFAGIMGLLTASLVQIFLPFNQNVDFAIAAFSVLLFSGFVLYDTQQIMKRLSVDEAILGALTLYLDFLNLFLSILRILNNAKDR